MATARGGVGDWYVARSVVAGALVTAMAPLGAQPIALSTIGGTSPGYVVNGETGSAGAAGRSMAGGGDFNGDGLGDVLVGSPFLSGSERTHLVYGKTSSSAVNLTNSSSSTQMVMAVEPNFYGLGDASASVGDVNGDGLGDLLVAASGNTPSAGPPSGSGRAYVVFGRTAISTVALTAVATGTSTLGFAILAANGGDRIGQSLAGGGDINGDGLADLIIGAPLTDPPAGADLGRAFVVFGKSTPSNVALSEIQAGTSAAGFAIEGAAPDDVAGGTVSNAGDVNGDGLDDLIMGAPFATSPAATPGTSAGRSYVVFGRTSNAVVALSDVIAGTGGFVINGEQANGRSGRSVSGAGDLDNDGLADLLIGASGHNLGMFGDGRAYVVWGRTATTAVALSDVSAGTGGWRIDGESSASHGAGVSVASAGDVDGDGIGDLLVGAPYSTIGRAYLVLGKTTPTAVALSDVANGTGGRAWLGEASFDNPGARVAPAGDANGDGTPDIAIAAPSFDLPARADAGRCYVVFPPITPATSGTYALKSPAGAVPRTAVGSHTPGSDATALPNSRLWIEFDGGTGTAPDSSSMTNVTITRNTAGIAGFPPGRLANVQWNLTGDRTGFAAARVTVRYTNAELGSIPEGGLHVYSAPTAAGPFTLAGSITRNAARNEISATIPSLPRVVVVGDAEQPTVTITRLSATPLANQVADWSVVFSEDVSPTFTAADITPTGTLGNSTSPVSVVATSITGADYAVRVASNTTGTNGTLRFQIVGSGVADKAGNSMVTSPNAPLYDLTLAAPLAGDVNKDGLVNTADITTLGNFIANGTPLP